MLLLLQIKMTPLEAGVLFGAILGALIGLVPLIFGIIKKKAGIGILGFAASIIGNSILGILLSIPVAAVCTYLILKKENIETVPDSEISDVSDDSKPS